MLNSLSMSSSLLDFKKPLTSSYWVHRVKTKQKNSTYMINFGEPLPGFEFEFAFAGLNIAGQRPQEHGDDEDPKHDRGEEERATDGRHRRRGPNRIQ